MRTTEGKGNFAHVDSIFSSNLQQSVEIAVTFISGSCLYHTTHFYFSFSFLYVTLLYVQKWG